MKLYTKDLLTLNELSSKEFVDIIDAAISSKKQKDTSKQLSGRTLAMIFQKPSTRTRISFETGMYQLGGHAINISINEMQLSRGESIQDTAKTLSRYVDCIMARVYEHTLLEQLAKNADIPVINGLSDTFHPCQILADFMTIKEKFSSFKDLKIAWIGDGNNVCNSMLYGAALSGVTMSVATPKEFEPDKTVVKHASEMTEINLYTDPVSAVSDADVIVTDTFTSIHNSDNSRLERFLPKYQVNTQLMRHARDTAIFMHCLPAKRGQEVTADIIDGNQSVVWDEAENRLYVQKVLLASLIH